MNSFGHTSQFELNAIFEIEVTIFYLALIYVIALQIKKKNIQRTSLYKYFIPGLLVRLMGGVMVCMIYLFYYKGGDTINYYKGSICMINLMFDNFPVYLDIMMGNLSPENYLSFTRETGYPPSYMYRDEKTFALIRYVNPLVFLCMKSFVSTTIVLSALAYSGPWRVFLMFCREFPGLSKQLAVSVLFIPSVFFWGSGLLKDTFTFSAVCWYTFSFYKAFIIKEKRFPNMVYMLISIWVLIAIKPYLFIAIFPGSVLWYIFTRLQQVRNALLRVIFFPFIVGTSMLVAFTLVSVLGSQMGKYRLDNIIDVAIITQDDLSRDTYGPNSFDIGELDGSITGMVSKAPTAIVASFFRPFIWEINNPVMFLSGLENLIILVIFMLTLIKIRPLVIVQIIVNQPILLFCLIYSVLLAFAIGISTANFGALVRYKIPFMPFFISSLLIIQYYYKYHDPTEVVKEM